MWDAGQGTWKQDRQDRFAEGCLVLFGYYPTAHAHICACFFMFCRRWYAVSHILAALLGAVAVQWAATQVPGSSGALGESGFGSAGIVVSLFAVTQTTIAVLNNEYVSGCG